MSKLIGKNIKLRALELTDIDFLYDIENNDTYWGLSNTQTPFSRYTLEQYIKNAHLDIYEAKQIRFAIESKKGQTIGMIDLFDFNPQ
ncbi:MAG: GNAT family N-acetyltransferase, partial [Wenyingzhuangia sp.]